MKKICLFLCLICCFGISNANAGKKCLVTTCPQYVLDKIPERGACKNENCREYIRSVVGGTQCYSCDSNDDSINSDQCAYKDLVGQRDALGNIIGIYECVDMRGTYDGWSEHNPTRTCENSVFRNGAPKSSYNTYYLLKGEKSEKVSAGDHMVIPAGSDGCVYYECQSGFVPNADKTDCIKLNKNCERVDGSLASTGDKAKIQCEKDAKTIKGKLAKDGALKSLDNVIQNDSSKCTATCKADGWDILLNKDGCKEDYEPNKEFKACEENAATKDERRKKEQEANKQVCVNSGGTWGDGTGCTCNKSHMKKRADGKACECVSNAYKFNADKRTCEITDLEQLKQNCEKAAKNSSSGVERWDGVSKCICKDSANMYSFDGVSKCVQDENYARCIAKSEEAYWNKTENKCVCLDKDFEWNYNRCDKKAEVIISENEEIAAQGVRTLVNGLTEKFAGLGRSVWKDKDGNFNKARLASDSIAGVVLGTAGGLITSNVVKKSQVKSGFEDISCTVGGQKVADWSDEFTVGIK